MTISAPKTPRLILASASPRRQEILKNLGLIFRIDPSFADEPVRKAKEAPERYAIRAARAKVRDVSKKYRSGLVIGADTIVVVGKRILGKPRGEEEAGDMLRTLDRRWHEVITGLCVMDVARQKIRFSHTRSRVHFRRLTDEEIEWYLATGEYRDKAGAYAIQGYASLFIDRIEGCYFNIVGFPVSAFERLLKCHFGLRISECQRSSGFKIRNPQSEIRNSS